MQHVTQHRLRSEQQLPLSLPPRSFLSCVCLYLHEYDKERAQRSIRSQTVRTTTSTCVQPQKFTSSRQISVVRFLGGCCSTCGNYDLLLYSPVACLLLSSRQLGPHLVIRRPTLSLPYLPLAHLPLSPSLHACLACRSLPLAHFSSGSLSR